MKTICKIFELKLKGLHEHLGADCQRVFLSVQLLRSLQAWENKKWRVEFVSARLRKIRYHVLLSVWCQALWVVPECLIPLRLQRRPQMWQRFNQSSRLQPLTGSHFPLFISSVSLFTSYFSPPSLFYLSDFSSSCVTLCSQRWLTSPLVYVTLRSQSQTRRGGLAQSQRHSDIQLDTLFASSSNRCQFVIRNMCFSPHFAGLE